MGKSLYIRRRAESLQKKLGQTDAVHVTIPLHGPVVTPDTVLELFKDHLKKPICCIYHIDIAPNVRTEDYKLWMWLQTLFLIPLW